MTSLAIMQPYLFPYLGYYQLVHAVDQFVFFDDVNFIKKGWINRNQLLLGDSVWMFSVPLLGVSQNKLICNTQILDRKKWLPKFLRSIEMGYAKAPYYTEGLELLNKVCSEEFGTIDKMAVASITEVFNYVGVKKHFLFSSDLTYDHTRPGVDKIISICKLLNTKIYINPENGGSLYKQIEFNSNSIELKFIKKLPVNYVQFRGGLFVDNLSLLDVIMNNSKNQILELLTKYSLTNG